MIDPAIERHYGTGHERSRLLPGGMASLEYVRSMELLERLLPPPPARLLDVGGGPGAYAVALARRGYRVHLVDPVPLHVAQARQAAAADPAAGFTAAAGDARELAQPDESQDAVMLFGPLYHLTEAAHRRQALAAARRVLAPGGRLLAMAISRFASLLDGLYAGRLGDPEFRPIVDRDLADGQHRNPDPAGRSSSPPPTSICPANWLARSNRRVSPASPSTGSRAPAGRCARPGRTRSGESTSCSPPARWRRKARSQVSALTSSPSQPSHKTAQPTDPASGM